MNKVVCFLERHPRLSRMLSSIYNILNFNYVYGKGFHCKGNFMKKCHVKICGRNNVIIIEDDGLSRLINTKFYIHGHNNVIRIGKRCSIINAEFWIEDNNNQIILGNNNSICGKTHIAAIEGTKIIFGNDCLFSTNVTFRTGDSHSILSLDNKRINSSKDILIADHVWFGNDTKVLKGVSILKDTIVGTGAIVTSSVKESNVVLGGIPAKIIKRNITWNVHRIPIQ